MPRSKSYYFLIDNLSVEKAQLLRRGLLELSAVLDVKSDVHSGLIEVVATRKIAEAVETACAMAGLAFRREVKRSEL